MELEQIEIFADGGYRKGGGYGSFIMYRMLYREELVRDKHCTNGLFTSWIRWAEAYQVPLPEGITSNEAEYLIQIRALNHLFGMLGECPEVASRYSVVICSDSALVINQIMGLWKVRAENLKPLRDELLVQLLIFGDWSARWVPREVMIEKFGH